MYHQTTILNKNLRLQAKTKFSSFLSQVSQILYLYLLSVYISSINPALPFCWLVFDFYPACHQGPSWLVLWVPIWVLRPGLLASILTQSVWFIRLQHKILSSLLHLKHSYIISFSSFKQFTLFKIPIKQIFLNWFHFNKEIKLKFQLIWVMLRMEKLWKRISSLAENIFEKWARTPESLLLYQY